MSNSLLHPFSLPEQTASDYVNIVRGEGSIVFDDSGKDYVDGLANLWLCQVGYGRTKIVEAVTNQMSQIHAYNTFPPFTNSPAERITEMIVERSPHPDGRVFLGSSGSEAIDTVLKIARVVMQQRGQAERQIIVKRTNGYQRI